MCKDKQHSVCDHVATVMDFLPTLARLAGAEVPDDRAIDGHDIRPLLYDHEGASSPYDAFFYYGSGNHTLEAVRAGKWKLFLLRDELYDLEADQAEAHNLFAKHPDIVSRLQALADECRRDLGDAHTDEEGANCRPAGRVPNPKPLTSREQLSPHLRALYDLDDLGEGGQAKLSGST